MDNWIIPDWPAPANVKALITTRHGGVSSGMAGRYASFNLAMHVNDDQLDVACNRTQLRRYLPSEPKWLQQVHGTLPVWIDCMADGVPQGDAALCGTKGHVCVVMVADCLPVFLCDMAGTKVGVIHAGWRGLAGGIIERSIAAMQVNPGSLMAWLGPAIGPDHFEVGRDVYETFVQQQASAAQAFVSKNHDHEKKWLADIFMLARQRLETNGITRVYGGGICTFSDSVRFFSYRRDGETGRMAALIWLQ